MIKFTVQIACDRCGNSYNWSGTKMTDLPSRQRMLDMCKREGWKIKHNKALRTKDLLCDECLGGENVNIRNQM